MKLVVDPFSLRSMIRIQSVMIFVVVDGSRLTSYSAWDLKFVLIICTTRLVPSVMARFACPALSRELVVLRTSTPRLLILRSNHIKHRSLPRLQLLLLLAQLHTHNHHKYITHRPNTLPSNPNKDMLNNHSTLLSKDMLNHPRQTCKSGLKIQRGSKALDNKLNSNCTKMPMVTMWIKRVISWMNMVIFSNKLLMWVAADLALALPGRTPVMV
jgi:hypothetical protein